MRAEEGFPTPAPLRSSSVWVHEFLWYLYLNEEKRAEGSRCGEGERGEPKERQPGGSYSLFIPHFPLISVQSSLLDLP